MSNPDDPGTARTGPARHPWFGTTRRTWPRAQLAAVVAETAQRCRLGTVRAWAPITTGYDDTSVAMTTDDGRWILTIFHPARAAHAARTADLVLRARIRGVRHPHLRPDPDGAVVHRTRFAVALVIRWVAGQDYHRLRRPPTVVELHDLLEQAELLHGLDVAPTPVHDPASIANLPGLAAQLWPLLDPEQRALVAAARSALARVDLAALPARLIHGALTKSNVLVDLAGAVIITDFGRAGRYPRIQELAVIAANLTHGAPTALLARADELAALYPAPLTAPERAALPHLTHAAAAMEFLRAAREALLHGDRSLETTALLELGLTGLRSAHRHLGRPR